MIERKNLAGHLAALFTILIWGTTFVSTKVLLRSFQPIEILFFRFALGYLALLLAKGYAALDSRPYGGSLALALYPLKETE